MSRRSTRLVGKRKQQHIEYNEDVQAFGKRRKVDQQQTLLVDVTNEVNSPLSHLTMTPASDDLCRHQSSCACPHIQHPVFYLPSSFSSINPLQRNPLPDFRWADSDDVWKVMMEKEEKSSFRRDPLLFERHPGLDERMRAILLDWLIEVSEVYKMHRETFYMCADYIDRYLSRTSDVKKSQLQLIGITALFIAAKMEEIYPSRLGEFSYVTDGACTEDEILEQEIIMLQVLRWDLSPITSHTYLTTFYQTACSRRPLPSPTSTTSTPTGSGRENKQVAENQCRGSVVASSSKQRSVNTCSCSECFLNTPQFAQKTFLQIIRLLDLCVLHSGWLEFPYSVLAASVLHYHLSPELALSVSGLQWSDIAACVTWMSAFVNVLDRQEAVELKSFTRVSDADAHNIQTHSVSLQLLDLSREFHRTQQLLCIGEVSRGSPANLSLPATGSVLQNTSSSSRPVAVTPPITDTPLVMTPPNSQKSKSKFPTDDNISLTSFIAE